MKLGKLKAFNSRHGGYTMMKFFGKNNGLRTEDGKITKLGYAVMLLSSVFGLCVFLTGRYLYGKSLREKQSDENHSLSDERERR